MLTNTVGIMIFILIFIVLVTGATPPPPPPGTSDGLSAQSPAQVEKVLEQLEEALPPLCNELDEIYQQANELLRHPPRSQQPAGIQKPEDTAKNRQSQLL
jgi:hypothetical protein